MLQKIIILTPEEEAEARKTRLIKNVNGTDTVMGDEEEAELRAFQAAAQKEVEEAEARARAEKPRLDILAQINELEALQTPRRIAEAILTEEGREWLEENRAQVDVLRAQLTALS